MRKLSKRESLYLEQQFLKHWGYFPYLPLTYVFMFPAECVDMFTDKYQTLSIEVKPDEGMIQVIREAEDKAHELLLMEMFGED